MLRTEENRDIWRRLFEDCNKKQGEEIERLRQESKDQSKRLGLTTMELSLSAGSVPCGQSLIELLRPRELSQTTEVQVPTALGRVTVPDSSNTLGDPVEELVEHAAAGGGRWPTCGR